jgi:hypothetical protein
LKEADPPVASFYAALQRHHGAAPLADFATALNTRLRIFDIPEEYRTIASIAAWAKRKARCQLKPASAVRGVPGSGRFGASVINGGCPAIRGEPVRRMAGFSRHLQRRWERMDI